MNCGAFQASVIRGESSRRVLASREASAPARPRRHRPSRTVAVASLALLVAAACGSRLSRQEILAQSQVRGVAGAPRQAGDAAVAGAGGQTASTLPGEQRAGGQTASTLPGGQRAGGQTAGAAPRAGAPSGAAASGPAPAASKEPIVVGLVGWLTGLGGISTAPSADVVGAWAQWINAQGGINGHPVKLLVGDDGGDSARSVAIAKDFVENKGAIALIDYLGSQADAVASYAQSRRVAVVGGAPLDPVWSTNPSMFPTGAGPTPKAWGLARRALDAGIKKIAVMYCAEVAGCKTLNDEIVRFAQELGLEVVYKAQISLAQPDFTSECLQARNQGAQAIIPTTDINSIVRIAQSCSRQGYQPRMVIWDANDAMTTVPELDGTLVAGVAFPWFLYGGSPALEEYGAAVRRYAPHLLNGQNGGWATTGWDAGKLLEFALKNVPDKPTTSTVFEGLWKAQGERLGGLTPPLTYTRDQPTPGLYCFYASTLKGGKWTADRGADPVCR